MSIRIKAARRAAFHSQEGKCFYCLTDMWEMGFESSFEAAARLFGLTTDQRGVKTALRKKLCTAEHLVRRADNGDNQDDNIVAACMDCNTRRGTLSVEEYIELVRNRGKEIENVS